MSLRYCWQRFAELELSALYAVMQLRQEVFVVEQDCAFQDADGKDVDAWHLLIWDGAVLAAYLRVHAPGVLRGEAVISRVITAPSHRRQGLGLSLLGAAVERVQQSYPQAGVWLGAQQRLEAFYGKFGFLPCSDPYLEDGIWHVGMRAAAVDLRIIPQADCSGPAEA